MSKFSVFAQDAPHLTKCFKLRLKWACFNWHQAIQLTDSVSLKCKLTLFLLHTAWSLEWTILPVLWWWWWWWKHLNTINLQQNVSITIQNNIAIYSLYSLAARLMSFLSRTSKVFIHLDGFALGLCLNWGLRATWKWAVIGLSAAHDLTPLPPVSCDSLFITWQIKDWFSAYVYEASSPEKFIFIFISGRRIVRM